MKTLLFALILVTIWTQAKAEDPHYPPYVDPGTTTTTNTSTTLNLNSEGAIASAMAGGLHQFDASTDDLQLSISAATYEGNSAASFGAAMRLNKKLLLSGSVNVGEGGAYSGGGAVGFKF